MKRKLRIYNKQVIDQTPLKRKLAVFEKHLATFWKKRMSSSVLKSEQLTHYSEGSSTVSTDGQLLSTVRRNSIEWNLHDRIFKIAVNHNHRWPLSKGAKNVGLGKGQAEEETNHFVNEIGKNTKFWSGWSGFEDFVS